MRKFKFFNILILFLFITGKALALQPACLDKLEVHKIGDKLEIILTANTNISHYTSFELSHPTRLVIDFPKEFKYCRLPKINSLGNDVYPRLRWIILKGKLRCVVDCRLKKLPFYKIKTQDHSLILTLSLKSTKRMPPVEVKGIDFEKISPQKCRLVVATSREVPYEIYSQRLLVSVLRLKNTHIPEYLCRELDTSFFPCGLKRIVPYQMGKDVAFKIEFEHRIPFRVVSTQNHLYVIFSSPEETKPIAISKILSKATKKENPKIKPKAQDKTAALPKTQPANSNPLIDLGTPASAIILPGSIQAFKGVPVSLDFQDADIKNVFRILAEVSGLNILVSDKVKGKVTLKLDRVPWDQVFDLLLQTYNLGAVKRGKVIRVVPITDLKKEQELLIQAQRSLEKKKESEPLITREIQVNYVKAADLVKQLQDIKSARGKITYDEMTNRIIMTDVKDRIEKAEKLVRSLDIAPRQVMIEARIVEVNTNYSKELGVQWGGDYSHAISQSNILGFQGRAAEGDLMGSSWETTAGGESLSGSSTWQGNVPLIVNLPPSGTYGGIGLSLAHLGRATTLILDAKLQAMESEGEGKVISVPKVITMDNQEAVISQGLEIPYRTTSQNGTTTEFREAVLKLTVTPHITPDKKVRLELDVKKDTAGEIQPGMDSIPIEKKEITTTLLVDNNETVVIGGILSEEIHKNRQKVPFFANIPLIGWLFQSKTRQTQKRELLIFITPKVLNASFLTAE